MVLAVILFPIEFFRKKNICLIGISHIIKDIKLIIEDLFQKFKPEILVLELNDSSKRKLIAQNYSVENDNEDLNPNYFYQNHELKNEKSPIKTLNEDISFNSLEFLKTLQDKIGIRLDLTVGEEVLIAINLAKIRGIPIHAIDMPIQSIKKINTDAIKNIFGPFDIHDYSGIIDEIYENYLDLMDQINNEDFILKILKYINKKSPELYDSIFKTREQYMSKKIEKICQDNPNKRVLIIIGAAHFIAVKNFLKKSDQDK